MKEDIYKQLNEIKDNSNKLLKELKDDTNKQLTLKRKTMQDMKGEFNNDIEI
jgi:hypothetical protein